MLLTDSSTGGDGGSSNLLPLISLVAVALALLVVVGIVVGVIVYVFIKKKYRATSLGVVQFEASQREDTEL